MLDAHGAAFSRGPAPLHARATPKHPTLSTPLLPMTIITARPAGDTDLVTETDKRCEALVLERIRQAFPDHKFIGEEGSAAQVGAGRRRWELGTMQAPCGCW